MAGSSKKDDIKFTPPASPSGSYYDLSDDDESDYNTITHTSTGRSVKLLFSKSKVYVHPSASQKDNIPGFIALLHQKQPFSDTSRHSDGPSPSSLLLAWVPESALGDAYDTYVKVDLASDVSPPRQTYLVPPPPASYTSSSSSMTNHAFCLPVSQIYSLLIRPPNLGWWYGSIVVNSRAGDSFPALFFHDSECASTIAQGKKRAKDSFDPFGEQGGLFWGGDEVLRWLRKYVRVEKSQVEPMLYLVDPTPEDLLGFVTKPVVEGKNAGDEGAGMDPITKVWKEARWNLLEKLTRVTRFTRRTAEDILDSPRLPPQLRTLLRSPEVERMQEEFDSARIYLARWAMGIAEASEKEHKQRVWSPRDLQEIEDSDVGEFEILDLTLQDDAFSGSPVTLEEWKRWQDRNGQLTLTPHELKGRIFHTGIDPDARPEIWLFLLDVYPWDSTAAERTAIMNSRRDEYLRLKARWWNDLPRLLTTDDFREQKSRIEKDVHRTDRTIPIFAGEDIPHPDPDSPFAETGTNVHMEMMKDLLLTYNESNTTLGYVQGMSDLLSPLYAVFQDDAVAFTAFVNFMERTERNFLRDQSGMRSQLVTLDHLVQLLDPKLYAHLQSADSTNFFFFFRMLLVWFKREFEWDDIQRLWEALWTNLYSSQYHLFIAIAILERHRKVIMDHLKQFDEVLKYFNELSGTIDVKDTLVRSEVMWKRFRRLVEETDRADKGGLGNAKGKGKKEEDKEVEEEKKPAISDELRALLKTEIVRP